MGVQGKPEPNQPATIATDQAAAVQGRVLTALLSIYVWWFAATPDQRFPLVTEIYFERILVVALFIACLANARKGRLSRAGVVLLLLFFAWCELSYALSPYQHFIFAERWQAEYWKIVVFVVLVVFALGDEQLTRRFLLGTAIALFIYQVHSQLDFQRGGSYVYQQGLRRMAGVWSGGGIGAANAWGVLSLITLPFAVQWRDLTASPRWRHVGIVMAVICAASIVYSGTRGALVCAVPYGAVVIWRRYGAVRHH